MSQNVDPNDPNYVVSQPIVEEVVSERVRAVPDQVATIEPVPRKSFAPWLFLALIGCLVLAYLLGRMFVNRVEPSATQTVLTCGETDIEVKTVEDYIIVTREGETTNMPQVEAASGARYQSGDFTLWNEGNEWMAIDNIDQPNEVITPCTVH